MASATSAKESRCSGSSVTMASSTCRRSDDARPESASEPLAVCEARVGAGVGAGVGVLAGEAPRKV